MTTVCRIAFALGLLMLIGACGEASDSMPPRATGGAGGSLGTGGDGTGGTGAVGGSTGTGGAGTGGSVGTGGSAGTGGTGGTGGTYSCTNALCHSCPDPADLCDSDLDCSLPGHACIPTGCETEAGAPMKRCLPLWGPSCTSVDDCPNPTDYACSDIGGGKSRCQRVAAGCNPAHESIDCPPGFSCEGDACVDRRVPCDDFTDCPKNHVCHAFSGASSSYCVRANRDCNVDTDCVWYGVTFGDACVDVDGDGRTECAGKLGASDLACVTSDPMCTGSVPVCEAAPFGNARYAACSAYGLCLDDGDCDVAGGFECVGLWQDGRAECVPVSGTCNEVTDCPPQQVCAAPRNGGPPSCQSGKEAP